MQSKHKRLKTLLLGGALVLLSMPAMGADKGGTTIFDDYPRSVKDQPARAARPGYFYVGVTAGQTYSKDELLDDRIQFFDKDRNWVAGGYVGFMVRPQQGPFEIGIEADYIWTDIKFTRREEGGPILEAKAIEGVITVKDQWNASVRGRAGIHIVEPLMLYGTAGAAWSDLGGSGMVYGGGLELALGPVVALRAEVLRYELDDVSSNVVRGGITLKTN